MGLTLRQLMDVTSPSALFRVYANGDDSAGTVTILNEDYVQNDEDALELIAPLLGCKVLNIDVGVSADPLAPKNELPTLWVDVAKEG